MAVSTLEASISAVLSVVGVAEVFVVLFAAEVECLFEDIGAEPVGVVTILGGGLGEDLGETLGIVFGRNTNVVVLLDVKVEFTVDGPFLLLVVLGIQLNRVLLCR